MPLVSFYPPENIRKPKVLGGQKRDQWHELGWIGWNWFIKVGS